MLSTKHKSPHMNITKSSTILISVFLLNEEIETQIENPVLNYLVDK